MIVHILSEFTRDEIEKMNKEVLSKHNIEICGVKQNDKYLVLGAGYESCSFSIPEDFKKPLTAFHTHPRNEPPSPTDIRSAIETGVQMEVLTPEARYFIDVTNENEIKILIDKERGDVNVG